MKLVFEVVDTGVRVSLYEHGLRGWMRRQCTMAKWRTGDAQVPGGERLADALRPVVLGWGVPPQTSAIAVADIATGGLVCGSIGHEEKDTEAISAMLARALPYDVSEVSWLVHRLAPGGAHEIQVSWIQNASLAELDDACSRVGVRLSEVYPVSALLPGALKRPLVGASIWYLQSGERVGLWALGAGKRVTACGVVGAPRRADAARRLALISFALAEAGSGSLLSLVSADDEVTQRVCSALTETATIEQVSAPDIVELALAAWMGGEEGWWRPPSRDHVFVRTAPWIIALSFLAIVCMGVISWQRQHYATEAAKLDDASMRERPAYVGLKRMKRQLFRVSGQLLTVDGFEHARSPLEVLAVITQKLPNGAWITHYGFDGRRFTADGQGVAVDNLVRAMNAAGYAAHPIRGANGAASQPNAGKHVAHATNPAAAGQFALEIDGTISAKSWPHR